MILLGQEISRVKESSHLEIEVPKLRVEIDQEEEIDNKLFFINFWLYIY